MAISIEQAIWQWAIGISGGNQNPGWQYEAGTVFVSEKGRLPCSLEEWVGWLTAKGILPAWPGYDRNPKTIINPNNRRLAQAPYPQVGCPDGTNGCAQAPWTTCTPPSTVKPPAPTGPPATGGTSAPATGTGLHFPTSIEDGLALVQKYPIHSIVVALIVGKVILGGRR